MNTLTPKKNSLIPVCMRKDKYGHNCKYLVQEDHKFYCRAGGFDARWSTRMKIDNNFEYVVKMKTLGEYRNGKANICRFRRRKEFSPILIFFKNLIKLILDFIKELLAKIFSSLIKPW
jgi:hypothetical protein